MRLFIKVAQARPAPHERKGRSANISPMRRRDAAALPFLLLLIASVLPSITHAIPADELDAIRTELKQPVTLKLVNRNTVVGHPINVSGNQIRVASAEGAGEIIFTFQANEIQEIQIPGEAYKTLALEWMQAGKTEDALALMSMLYTQRNPLLPLMPASESNFFVFYADLVLDSPKPARAIAITDRLRPQIKNPDALRMLDDAILESHQTLELYDQATPMAEQWLKEREAYGESALGYYVMGAAKIRAGEFEEAIELGLQPIVFSSPIPTDKLAHCYAVAISAALGLRERDYAATLYQEMQERGFEWPSNDRTLEPYLKELIEYIEDHEDS